MDLETLIYDAAEINRRALENLKINDERQRAASDLGVMQAGHKLAFEALAALVNPFGNEYLSRRVGSVTLMSSNNSAIERGLYALVQPGPDSTSRSQIDVIASVEQLEDDNSQCILSGSEIILNLAQETETRDSVRDVLGLVVARETYLENAVILPKHYQLGLEGQTATIASVIEFTQDTSALSTIIIKKYAAAIGSELAQLSATLNLLVSGDH